MSPKESMVNVKNALRVMSIICIVFVFCPSFLVSCSGQEMKVNVMTAVGGVSSSYGDKIVSPQPIMLLCLLLPMAWLVLLFIKKFTDRKTATIILGSSVVDLIMWFVFRTSAKRIAAEYYCSFERTACFVLNIISLLIIILFTILVVINKLQMDSDLIAVFTGAKAKNVMNQMSAAVNQMADSVTNLAGEAMGKKETGMQEQNSSQGNAKILYCGKCGAKLESDAVFCGACGGKVK